MKFVIFAAVAGIAMATIFLSAKGNKPTVIVMLGAPGAGKGTQSVMLSEKLGIPQISTGDLLRDHLKRNSDLGKQAKSYMDGGQLVPDQLVLDMLFNRIAQEDCKKGFILDGFPRTVAQAEALDKQLSSTTIKVISLEVPDEVIINRLTKRIVCSQCGAPYHLEALPPQKAGVCDKCEGVLISRDDDKEDVIKKRLHVFHEQTDPVKEHYRKKGLLIAIPAEEDKNRTFNDIMKALE